MLEEEKGGDLGGAINIFDEMSDTPNVDSLPARRTASPADPVPTKKPLPVEEPTEETESTARRTFEGKLPALPRAYRLAKQTDRTPLRHDPTMKRASLYYSRAQLLVLKKMRDRIEELTEFEVDLSDLASEGVDLLFKKYKVLMNGAPEQTE